MEQVEPGGGEQVGVGGSTWEHVGPVGGIPPSRRADAHLSSVMSHPASGHPRPMGRRRQLCRTRFPRQLSSARRGWRASTHSHRDITLDGRQTGDSTPLARVASPNHDRAETERFHPRHPNVLGNPSNRYATPRRSDSIRLNHMPPSHPSRCPNHDRVVDRA